jgi:small-conductance mechanosensitive channel
MLTQQSVSQRAAAVFQVNQDDEVKMKKWLDLNAFLGIAAIEWLYAALTAILSYIVISNVLKFVIVRFEALAPRAPGHFGDMAVAVLKGTHRFSIMLAALLLGIEILDMPEKWAHRSDQLWFIVIGFQIGLWLNRGVTLWAKGRPCHDSPGARNPVITTMLSWILRAFLWSVILLAVLANMGVNITAFVASLGVGGVAVALAVQSILSDLFASLAIGLDKPFEMGDFIVFGSIAGSVEHVGLKTTRIRSLSGEEIVCGNTELLKNTIHNYRRMSERRILFGFRVTYDATPDQLRRIPSIARKAVESVAKTRFDRAHFKAFEESALSFEVVYYVTDPGYNVYMDIQQSINLDLMTELAAIGVAFGFPTRTLHIAAGGAPARPEQQARAPAVPAAV